jgi:hypothetical protein
MYAEEFGWDPEIVDRIPLAREPWLIPIVSAIRDNKNRLQAEAQENAEKKAGKHRRE